MDVLWLPVMCLRLPSLLCVSLSKAILLFTLPCSPSVTHWCCFHDLFSWACLFFLFLFFFCSAPLTSWFAAGMELQIDCDLCRRQHQSCGWHWLGMKTHTCWRAYAYTHTHIHAHRALPGRFSLWTGTLPQMPGEPEQALKLVCDVCDMMCFFKDWCVVLLCKTGGFAWIIDETVA